MNRPSTLALALALTGPLLSAAQGGDPLPPTPTEAGVVTYSDAENRTSTVTLGPLGQLIDGTDATGLRTTVERDSRGNALVTTYPSGTVIRRSYDTRGNVLSVTDESVEGTARFTYDEFNRLLTLTDALGAETKVTYDSDGNPVRVETPVGRAVSAAFSDDGTLQSLTDTLGSTASVAYNDDQLPTQLTIGAAPNQRTIQVAYSSAGYVEQVTDASGRGQSVTYDPMGRVLRANLPDARTIDYTYDSLGQLTGITPPGRPTYGFFYNDVGLLASARYPEVTGGGTNQTVYAYSPARQLTRITRADGSQIQFTYDAAGRVQTVTQPNGNYGLSYSETTGLLESLSSPDGVSQAFAFDRGRLEQVSWSGEIVGSVGFEYDAKARVVALDIAGQSIAYGYNSDDDIVTAGQLTLDFGASSGLITGTTLSGLTEEFAYNSFAEPTGHTVMLGPTAVYAATYTRDAIGRITQRVETIAGVAQTTEYDYDLAGRLSSVTLDSTPVASYTYDTNNNRLGNAAAFDAQDRMISQTGESYSYNSRGERTEWVSGGDSTQYGFDVQGTLTSVSLPDDTNIEYLLDGMTRRVAKQVDGVTVEAWLYANALNPVAQLDGAGAVQQRYIYASRRNVPDYIETGGVTYKVVADSIGSVRLVVNASTGAIVQRIDYDAWGRITADSNPGFQPFAFAGGLYDNDTGLTHFGMREYDARTGRWISRDPIGFFGGTNHYEYAHSDPINLIDPTGLATDLEKSIRAGVSGFATLASVVGPFLPAGAGQLVGAAGLMSDIFTNGLNAGDVYAGLAPQDAVAASGMFANLVGMTAGAFALAGSGPAGWAAAAITAANYSPKPAYAVGEFAADTVYPSSHPQNIFATRAFQALPPHFADRQGPVKCFKYGGIGR